MTDIEKVTAIAKILDDTYTNDIILYTDIRKYLVTMDCKIVIKNDTHKIILPRKDANCNEIKKTNRVFANTIISVLETNDYNRGEKLKTILKGLWL